jgi:hypothetical protein
MAADKKDCIKIYFAEVKWKLALSPVQKIKFAVENKEIE